MSFGLILQLLILAACGLALLALWRNFPYPSPLIGPLLPPQKRWPIGRLTEWVEEGKAPRGFIAFFLRDPEREIPPGNSMISPVDGTVLDIIRGNEHAYIVLSLNVWDVHVARAPYGGTIVGVENRGDTLAASVDDPNPASRAARADATMRDEPLYFMRDKRSPVQKAVMFETAIGTLAVRFITSYLSRRIELYKEVGESLERGERMGRMLFGSTAVVEVDERFRFLPEIGARVVGGQTVLIDAGQMSGDKNR